MRTPAPVLALHRRLSAAQIAGGFAVIAAGLRVYQLTRPGLLLGVTPDVSAWFGGGVRLVHGVMPYRDFGYTQPPGFLLLTSPLALLSKLTGTRLALAVLRGLTPLLAAASVLLAGRLVRHRGRLAVLLSCAIVALHPAELYALHGPQLEPVVNLLCLGGLVLAFPGGGRASGQRLAWAGAAFGMASAVKLPALIPFLVVCAVLADAPRRRLVPFLSSGAGAFALVLLPFAAFAPAALLRDVVGTQLGRVPAAGRDGLGLRLGEVTGGSAFTPSNGVAVAIATVFAAAVLAGFVAVRRRPDRLEVSLAACTAAVLLAQLGPARYYPQYAAFTVPFTAALLGVSAGRLTMARAWAGRSAAVVSAAAVVALLAVDAGQSRVLAVPDVAAVVDARVPAGACAISDSPVLLFTSDRFLSDVPGCPPLTDPEGATLALGSTSQAATAMWRDAFEHAAYIVTSTPIEQWTLAPDAGLAAYTSAHFSWQRTHGLLIYTRR